MATTQYIGSRYVPLFADPAEWNNTRAYEPLTIVLHEGNSYTSKQYVPVGIDIANGDYWAETGNYNAQIELYRQEVESLKKIVVNTFHNTAALALCANVVGDYVSTLGFNTPGDGGEAIYVISANGNVDNISTFKTLNGVATIIDFNFIEALGAKGDGVFNCTSAFSKCHDLNHPINLRNGVYLVDTLTFNNVININGNGCTIKSNTSGVVVDCLWPYTTYPAFINSVNFVADEPLAILRIGHTTLSGNCHISKCTFTLNGGTAILHESGGFEIYESDFHGKYEQLTNAYAIKSTGGSDSKIVDVSSVNLATPFDVVCGYYWERVHPWIRPGLVDVNTVAFTIRSNDQYMTDCYSDSYGTDILFYGGAIKANQFMHFAPDNADDVLHTSNEIYLVKFDSSYKTSNFHRLNIPINYLNYPGYNFQKNIKVSNLDDYIGINFTPTQTNDMPSDLYNKFNSAAKSFTLKDSLGVNVGDMKVTSNYVLINISSKASITPPITNAFISSLNLKVLSKNIYKGDNSLFLNEKCEITGNPVSNFTLETVTFRKFL